MSNSYLAAYTWAGCITKTIRCLLFIIAVLFIMPVYSQDPVQYGTPFTAVPDPRDAVIYQVNTRCFSTEGNFNGVIKRLKNIQSLGVNVLYLMPVQPVGTLKAYNSPYCIKDLKAVAAEFGTLTDLRNLVDSAHKLGMAVILDWVPNQTSWDHPWITAHKDWYQQDDKGNIVALDNYSDIAALNLDNPAARDAMIDAMRYWVFAANIDGFRCDYANRAPVSFWAEAINNLRSINSHTLLMFAEGDRADNYTAGFDFNFSWNFFGKMKQIFNGEPATLINTANTDDYKGATGNQQIVRWLTNHDIYNEDGTPYNRFNGRNGTLAAFAVTALMKGVPFIYNGMEVGNTVDLKFPFTSTKINWNDDISVTPQMTDILTLRNSSDAIRRGVLTTYTNADVCAFKKVSTTDSIYVFINLRSTTKSFTLPAGIANKGLYNAFTGELVNFSTTITLAPYQYLAYSNIGPVTPAVGIVINTPTASIHGTGSVQLTANIEPVQASYKTIFWESGNPDLVSVSNSGLVTGISPGNTFVVARSYSSSVADTCWITLTGVAVTGISLTGNTETIKTGETKQLSYSILPADATNKNVTWKSGNESVVKVNNNGLITGLKKGVAEVSVTTSDGKKTATCTVTVEEGNIGFTVYVTRPENWATTMKIYYWEPLPEGILPSVNWPGVPMVEVEPGLYKYFFKNVTATNLIFNDGAGKQTVNLYRNKPGWYINNAWTDEIPEIIVEEVDILNSIETLHVGDSVQMGVSITPNNATNKKIVWKSTNKAIARVNENGWVFAVKTGTTKIIAVSYDETQSDTCIINVIEGTGVKNIRYSGASNVIVLPNPAGGGFVSVWLNKPENKAMFFITDIHGRTLVKGPLFANENKLDISVLKPGTYIVKIEKYSGVISQKLLVE